MNIKGRWGYINKEGKVAIKASYYEAGFFNFGLAPVRTRRSYRGWGFINVRGNWEITPQFEDARSFSEGLAAVKVEHSWGFIRQ